MTRSITLCSLLFALCPLLFDFRFLICPCPLLTASCLLPTVPSLLARCDSRAIDLYRLLRFLSFGRSMIDGVGYLDSFCDPAKRRELSIQVMPIADQYEEMRRGAIWLVGARHRNDAPDVFDFAWFVRNSVRHP